MTARESTLVSVVRTFRTILRNKWKFVGITVLVFVFFLWVLARLDLLPEASDAQTLSTVTVASANQFPAVEEEVRATESPRRIHIANVGVDVPVQNPSSTSISTLDAELLKGAVRYPTSGMLGEEGNVVVFAHSSYLPVVQNKYFKAFNGIQNLKRGDVIDVYGDTMVYHYAVDRVYEADASDTRIPLTRGSKKLTLSTCDSFGNLNDRFVVEAYFVGSTEISS